MGVVPAFNADPASAAAFWVGMTALVLAVAFVLSMLGVRVWLAVKQKLRQRVLNRWRPVLMASLYQPEASLPALSRFATADVLELWNHLYQSLDGAARDTLIRVAGSLRVPAAVSAMLRERSFRSRFLAAQTAGNLRLVAVWDVLRQQLEHESAALSLAAARALVRIDPQRATPLLLPQLLKRGDWPPQEVDEVLGEVAGKNIAESLFHAIRGAPPETARRLIRCLAAIPRADAAPVIGRLLAESGEEELLNACLQLLADPGELERVRGLTRHDNWHVRVHAATALGRLGSLDDAALLAGMLGDSQWWVRYRAALALAQLPGMTIDELRHIKDIQTDRYARDMLHQVMAELDLREGYVAARHD